MSEPTTIADIVTSLHAMARAGTVDHGNGCGTVTGEGMLARYVASALAIIDARLHTLETHVAHVLLHGDAPNKREPMPEAARLRAIDTAACVDAETEACALLALAHGGHAYDMIRARVASRAREPGFTVEIPHDVCVSVVILDGAHEREVLFALRGTVDIDNMTAKMTACFRAEFLRRFAGAT